MRSTQTDFRGCPSVAFFAALIHDAGHVGVPNTTLIQEDPSLAFKYNDTSVAEQNSLDVCWDLLMQDAYVDLRRCICADADELAHFRELLILMVMSTDGTSAYVASCALLRTSAFHFAHPLLCMLT